MNVVMAERTRSLSLSPEITDNDGGSNDSSLSHMISSVATTFGLVAGVCILFYLIIRCIGRYHHNNRHGLFPNATLSEPLLSENISPYQKIIDALNESRKKRGEAEIAVPEQFLCPITYQIMADPVVDKGQLNELAKSWSELSKEKQEEVLLSAESRAAELTPLEIDAAVTKRAQIKEDEKNICGNYFCVARFERIMLLKCVENPLTRRPIDKEKIISDLEMAAAIAAFVKNEQNNELRSQGAHAVTVNF